MLLRYVIILSLALAGLSGAQVGGSEVAVHRTDVDGLVASTFKGRDLLAKKKKPPPPSKKKPPPPKKRPPPPKKRPPPPKKRSPPPQPDYADYSPPAPMVNSSPPPPPPSPPPPSLSPPSPPPPPANPTLSTYNIVKTYPHDPTSFTEGLTYTTSCVGPCVAAMWESSGLFGQSRISLNRLDTGANIRSKALPGQDFGEGCTLWGDRVLQLTWHSGKMYSYAAQNLDDVVQLQTPLSDGWGFTHNDQSLIVSTGSSTIYYLDPVTLAIQRTLDVKDRDTPVNMLNDLQWVNGVIYANIWLTDCIAQIDPTSGQVIGWALMQGLKALAVAARPLNGPEPDVLNGIAYNAQGNELFVTGKQWATLFQVYLVPLDPNSAPAGMPRTLDAARAACIPQ